MPPVRRAPICHPLRRQLVGIVPAGEAKGAPVCIKLRTCPVKIKDNKVLIDVE